MFKNIYKLIIPMVTNRLFILSFVIVMMFSTLVVRLYQLQIIHGEEYQRNLKVTVMRTLPLPANRGNIYDHNGKPLAINKVAYTIKIDPSITVANLNEVLLRLIALLEKHNEKQVDEFPISKEEPFVFLFSSLNEEKRWKEDMNLKQDLTATDVFNYLRKFFDVPTELSTSEAHKLLSIRAALYVQRYKAYNPITLAVNVSKESVIAIEEQDDYFSSIFIDIDSLRYYPEGENFTHILGYMRGIDDKELEEYKQYGYVRTDVVGKTGVEKLEELHLSGKKGERVIEANASGKRVSEINTITPINGNNVFLTLDANLQEKSMEVLVENLKAVLLSKLNSGEITLKQLFISMVKSNNISIDHIMNAQESTTQYTIKKLIVNSMPNLAMAQNDDREKAKEIITNAIQGDVLSSKQMVLCLYEQGMITCDDDDLRNIKNNIMAPIQVVREKITANEITPQATNLDPSTGSVAVVEVNTGAVLSLVTYPSYDNNMLANNFNYEYYKKLMDDPTTPLVNRPLSQGKAPGSTLKMATAIAGLESGTITTSTKIQDEGIFTKAGNPAAKCLIYSRYGTTHGAVDVVKALEVSCNYFFYETAYRMSHGVNGNKLAGIEMLDKYLTLFGLADYSGIEIDHFKPQIASPENSQEPWQDGQTIRAAIGQSSNSFSAVNMAKYIATLANGGTRYKLHLIDKIVDTNGNEISKTTPIIEEQLNMDPKNLEAVYKGMLAVTSGSQGSLRKIFKDFPIQVAGKSGTAEEGKKRSSHTWFTGFAPYDNPQIAVVVMIPFGESAVGPASKTAKEIMATYFGLNSQMETEVKQ